MKRSDVHVARANDLVVADAERDAPLARVEEFLDGKAGAHTNFELGDFRDRSSELAPLSARSCRCV